MCLSPLRAPSSGESHYGNLSSVATGEARERIQMMEQEIEGLRLLVCDLLKRNELLRLQLAHATELF